MKVDSYIPIEIESTTCGLYTNIGIYALSYYIYTNRNG
ncbi:hypothetical protein KO116_P200133 (plasmid) [Halomonas sp. KO116]|nr:hypothetical protein KO116_P200133 [Halomonas sp. KO116]